MYKYKEMLVFNVESSLHAGSGSSLGHIDNPIQRETSTKNPIVQGNGVKGALREFYEKKFPEDKENKENKENKSKIKALFGGEDGNDGAGAVAFGEAKLLFFPVRSLTHIFAYITCPTVIARFQRDLQALGKSPLKNKSDGKLWHPCTDDNSFQAHSTLINDLPNKTLILEELPFKYSENQDTDECLNELASMLFPCSDEYKPFKENFIKRAVILSDYNYFYFVQYATEIEPHNRIDETGTVDEKTGVWYTEYLPSESILYSSLFIGKSHVQNNAFENEEKVKEYIQHLDNQRTWLGGDRTTGKGRVMMHLLKKKGGSIQ